MEIIVFAGKYVTSGIPLATVVLYPKVIQLRFKTQSAYTGLRTLDCGYGTSNKPRQSTHLTIRVVSPVYTRPLRDTWWSMMMRSVTGMSPQ